MPRPQHEPRGRRQVAIGDGRTEKGKDEDDMQKDYMAPKKSEVTDIAVQVVIGIFIGLFILNLAEVI